MHDIPLNLPGILPVLFKVAGFTVRTYTVFMILAFLTGILVYSQEVKKARLQGEPSFLIAIGAFVGSVIGAKVLELIINIDKVKAVSDFFIFILSGRTLIGGLIGGTLGVWLIKKILKIRGRRGNLFAPAIALGVAVGRIGCFFNGCCYGKPTNLPWGINFGDGISRHPTMLYESAFMMIMYFWLKDLNAKGNAVPGSLFTLLMILYFGFRFLVEFIRVERVAFLGFTWFQVIAIIVLAWLLISDRKLIFKATNHEKSI
ncbi:MAG TPA: prolipoprotein diacylglyceryl transferase family protein [Lentimicrobium sp.]|nr:prolipoprotein diacylglyceryl transferase family protein [Lentimicrobium sp.]